MRWPFGRKENKENKKDPKALTKDSPKSRITKREKIGPDGKILDCWFVFDVLTESYSSITYKYHYHYVATFTSMDLERVEEFKKIWEYNRQSKVVETVIE
jgi:hypothetical protein